MSSLVKSYIALDYLESVTRAPEEVEEILFLQTQVNKYIANVEERKTKLSTRISHFRSFPLSLVPSYRRKFLGRLNFPRNRLNPLSIHPAIISAEEGGANAVEKRKKSGTGVINRPQCLHIPARAGE